MRGKKKMKRLLAAAIAAVLLFGLGITAPAASGEFTFEQRTVRVGISSFPHFSEVSRDGTYSGIIIDYMNEIKKYTGWNVEYVLAEPTAAIDMLDSGEVDIMGGMLKNSRTEELYDFAQLSSGYAYSTITTSKKHTEYIPGDYDTLSGIRVGIFIKAVSKIEALKSFCEANGLEVTEVYFDDAQAWERAFQSGEVDAQLTSSAKLRNGEKIVASFQMEPYYFGVAKGNAGLLKELNRALEQIEQVSPDFEGKLYKKHFSDSNFYEFNLTSEEREFVDEHPVLRVAAAPDWEPISYFDRDGSFSGISADILAIISEETGFKLEYVQTKTLKEAMLLLKNGEVDMLAGVDAEGLGRETDGLAFSLPYLEVQAVMLHRNKENIEAQEAPVMAAIYGFNYNVLEKSARHNYDSARRAIDAVKRREADFTIVSDLLAEHQILNHGKGGLSAVPLSNANAEFSIAFADPTNPILLKILDRAIHSIDDSERQAIIFKSSMKGEITIAGLIYANPEQAIFTILFVGLAMAALIFLVMNMRLSLSRKSLLISDTYRIIGELSDEYIFTYNFETKLLSLPESFAKRAGLKRIISREECDREDISALIERFDLSVAEQNFSLECNCHFVDGKTETFRAVCTIIYDSAGRPARGIGKLVSIQAELDEKQRLEELLNTDSLTGLYTKRFCERKISEYIDAGSERSGGALMIIDVDNFKEANDTLGHLGGDAVLQELARVLESVFHNGEVIGRWGGDEFLAFMTGVYDRKSVEKKAEQLCLSMDREFHHEDASFALSVSVGIALIGKGESFREAFQEADDALYRMKRGKKNGYQFA